MLDPRLYEEVEANRGLTNEALLVVVLGSLAAGIGLGLSTTPLAIVFGILAALASWAVYAGLAYFVGTRWLAQPTTHANWGELLRTVGYANSPRVLLVALFIPVVGTVLSIVVAVWVLVATVIAVRQALDYSSTGRAVATAAIAWLGEVLILVLISLPTL